MLRNISAITMRATTRSITRRTAIRPLSTEAAAANPAGEPVGVPPPSTVAQAASPRVTALIDDLISLNMLEVKQLTDGLKDRLGIDDSAAMPMMNPAMFAGMSAPGGQAAQAAPPAPEKTAFDIKLEKFDAAKKIAIIKEVRAITGLGLKEAKAVVEAAPKVFKSDVAKDEAEQIKNKLQEIGAEIVLE